MRIIVINFGRVPSDSFYLAVLYLHIFLFLPRIDPMPDMEGRNLASNLRGIGVEQNNVPEWKQHITGGAKGEF